MRNSTPLFLVCLSVTGLSTFGLSHAESLSSEDPVTRDTLPQISSSQTREGRGVPFGRSDFKGPYSHEKMPIADNFHYGRTEHDPVKVGPRNGDLPHIRYLNSLRGPNGEPIEYERIGACCPFEAKDSDLGIGLLDVYRIRVDGQLLSEVYLLVDMYNSAALQVPAGFTQRK